MLLYSPRLALAFSQQAKLAGTGAVGVANQGLSVALSGDSNTAIVGGRSDNSLTGAAWVFTRSGGVWTQQGSKLTGTGAAGSGAQQGFSVALSGDGNTAIVGGRSDNGTSFGGIGAAWVFTRSGTVWTQQGSKLAGTGAVGNPDQGNSVALSGDGNAAILGGPFDNNFTGAAWIFTRSGTVWTQQGSKLTGTGAAGSGAQQGFSVALSGDGKTAILGGPFDSSDAGAAWVFVQRTLQVSPATGIAASGIQGQRFSPASFAYQLSSSGGSVPFAISGIPPWLIAAFTSGTLPPAVSDTFTVNACGLAPGAYAATISFTNTSSGQGDTTRAAALTVNRGSRDDCKDFGWRNFICAPGPFKNVFQCNKHFGL